MARGSLPIFFDAVLEKNEKIFFLFFCNELLPTDGSIINLPKKIAVFTS